MYLLAPFILQNFKKILKAKPLLLLGTNPYYYFHLPIGPFHWAKFKKNSYSGSTAMWMHHFWAQNGPFALNIFFFSKIIDITLIYLLAPFIVQNFKKILPADPEL